MANLKHAARRIIEEVYGEGRVEVLDELCHPCYVSHDPMSGDADLQGVKAYVRLMRACFPDLKASILGLYAEGDSVVTWWRMEGHLARHLLGIEPQGQHVTLEGFTLSLFEDGKLVEDSSQWNTLGYLQQLGLLRPLASQVGDREGRDTLATSQA
jgi:predicted ester cyclase